MRREWWICPAAFLVGSVSINLFGNETGASCDLLNKYSLSMISFESVSYEIYFIQVLLLRFKTAAGLWIAVKLLPKRAVAIAFAGLLSAAAGITVSMAIIENGVWGVLFFLSAMLPHALFYALAFWLWSNRSQTYTTGIKQKENLLGSVLILFIVFIGCVCESYLSPLLIEKVIEF